MQDVTTIGIILAALALGGLVKGVTGTGLPMVAVPVMAAFVGIQHAVAVMTVPIVVTNLWLVWTHRREAKVVRNAPVLFTTGVAGVLLGTWGLVVLDERLMSVVLATLVAAYIALVLARPTFRLTESVDRRIAPGVGLASGALQGATGMSGPLVVTYVHARRLDKEAHIFLTTAIYAVFSVVQAPALLGVGILTPERLLQSGLALVPALAFLLLGGRLAKSISRVAFDRVVLAVLGAIALKLAYEGLA